MMRAIQSALVIGLAAQALVIGQGSEASRILAAMRTALGGEALSAVKTVSIEGRSTRTRADGSSSESDFELAMELPEKFVKREVIANLGGTEISRRSGFNGAELIDEVDTPPAMGGGNVRVMRPGGAMPGGRATPEQIETQKRALLVSARRDFTRFSLGMFGAGSPAYPVEFTYAGQAESPDGKADILDVKAADGFTARLFVDATTHLPLMLTWMDKEPMTFRNTPGGPGNIQVIAGGAGHRPSPEEIEKLQKDTEQRLREAEANRRTVEYRIFYGEYKTVNGVRMPSKIQRMIDGSPTEELALEKIKVNATLDPETFRNR